ncbi:lipopolysaccharide biosynthesis protein [Altericroceibacterium endophyticum]|uniref:Oligosaccharide flippase family protein n=1 Tax=Altericroceibacterium endophyticum TaxID=1808508 RepID=A0A6I4SZE1_9SPHN|nr:oligosaccharide flippase family protein [Altericroceibacterium endophyticum]MXO64158.1 oligosaccharide flippase family protein [Altericroceibacterium endophyticum]
MMVARQGERRSAALQAVLPADRLWMLAASGIRLAGGVLVFVLLARLLGPGAFGLAAALLTYAAFAALIGDFGLSLYCLREGSAQPERAAEIMRGACWLKAVISFALILAGAFAAVFLLPVAAFGLVAFAALAALAGSYADLLLLMARIRRRYDREAQAVTAGTAATVLLVALSGVTTGDIDWALAAYAAGRISYLGFVLIVSHRWWGQPATGQPLRRNVRTTFHATKAYAADSVLTVTSGQIDILLFSALLGAQALGIYQAGARLAQSIMPLAIMLSAIYLPPLAAACAADSRAAFRRNAARLNYEFLILAMGAALGFAIFGPVFTRHIYGAEYASLSELWPGFAAYAALRMMAASFGIQLAANGAMSVRIAAQSSTIAAFAIAVLLIAPAAEPLWMLPWLLAAANLPLLLIMGAAAWSRDRANHSSAVCLAAIIAVVAALLLWQHFVLAGAV